MDKKIFYRLSNKEREIGEMIEPAIEKYVYESPTQNITENIVALFDLDYSSNRKEAVYLFPYKSTVENILKNTKKYRFAYACEVSMDDLIQVGRVDKFNELDRLLKNLFTKKQILEGPNTIEMKALLKEQRIIDLVNDFIEPNKVLLASGTIPEHRSNEFLFKKAKVTEKISKQKNTQETSDYFSDSGLN